MSASELQPSTPRRTAAWLTSIVVHAVVLLAVLWSFRGVVREPEPDPDRLVFVEPAPPPPPPPAPVVAGSVPEQPVEPVPEPARLVDAPTKAKPQATRKPTPRPTVAQVAAEPAAPKPAIVEGEVGGVEGGTVGGTVGGKIGGVVGGHGDEVVAANIAALAPAVTSRVLPEYPAQARAQRREGQVLLQAIVDREGRVEDNVVVLRSQPPFDEAAIKALRQWHFTPGKDGNGRAVRVQIEVPMRFQLK